MVGTSREEIAIKLLSLNDYYMTPLEIRRNDDKTFQTLHDLLALNGNGTYSSRSILRVLAPKCEDMVLRCYHGDYNPINCSDVFLLRMTGVGPCCVMNYRRSIDVLDLSIVEGNRTFPNRTIHVTTSGIRSAMQVVLQDNTTDFEWNTLGYDGYRVMLFNPENYPDPASGGGIGVSIANHDEEHEISIVPDVLEGSSRMKQFSPAKRHCYFLEEGKQLIQQPYYSFGECMVDCQIRSTINHCGCVIPLLSATNYNASYCSLLDLQCVKLWKPVWLRHNSFNYVSMEEGFNNCNHCMPSCSVLSYNTYVNSKPLNLPVNGGNYTVGVLAGLSSTIPTTVIKFFYKSSFSQIKTHDISGDWVALLGRYGGICGIMYGFSVIAIIELIYFITGKWCTLWWNSIAECFKNRQRSKVESEIHQELYWQELQPQVAFPIRKV